MDEINNKDVVEGNQELGQESENHVDDTDVVDIADDEVEQSEESSEEKVFTEKQLERRIEKRLKKERRNYERALEERLAKQRDELLQTQERYKEPSYNRTDDDYTNLSPQEYAKRVIDEERKLKQQEAEAEEFKRTQQETYSQLMKRGGKKYEDFEDVVNDGEYTKAIVNAALLHDNAEDIFYYFGKNFEKAEELSRKDPYEQAREVNRIAIKLASQNLRKRVSDAPAQVSAPKGNKSTTPMSYLEALKNPNMSLKELAKFKQR